jgi:protein ImuB
MYLFLPRWPIDRLRQPNHKPAGVSSSRSGAPVDAAPFATVIEAGGRRLVAAVNPAASQSGIAAGMPLADALSFLPTLVTAPAEPAADAAALGRLAEWCQRYSPWTAPDFSQGNDADGVKIEIAGSAHLWGGEAALAADLARRLKRQHIAHRLAVAGTLGAAWALARFAATEEEPALPAPDDERAALAPLPVEALRLDPAITAGLRRVGLRRVGELYPMPRDALARRFGEAVAYRLDQALGMAAEPLSPLAETPVRRVRLSFAEPIADPADLALGIERLAQDLVVRLAREGMGARRLDLAFHRVDGRVEHIQIGTARPSRDPKHLARLLAAKLETVDPGFGVEDMILAVFAVDKLPAEQEPLPRLTQAPLPPAGGKSRVRGASPEPASLPPHPNTLPRLGRGSDWGAIAPLLDRLGARLGLDALSHIVPHASHIPERASVHVSVSNDPHPDPPPLAGEGDKDRAGRSLSSHTANTLPRKRGRVGVGVGNADKPPRPVRLFQPPEPIEAAWLLPDDPPFHFNWRHRLHRVRRADGPERIAEEWWTAGAAMTQAAIRDYYRVEDAEGRRFWLFRAGFSGDPPPRWFLHGVFA